MILKTYYAQSKVQNSIKNKRNITEGCSKNKMATKPLLQRHYFRLSTQYSPRTTKAESYNKTTITKLLT